MRDREQAIKVLSREISAQANIATRTWPEVAERVIDLYEALPVVVTDEMVERAGAAWNDAEEYRMRAALEAALNVGGNTVDEK